MRAYEIVNEHRKRTPPQSLRHINKQKQYDIAKQASHAKHDALVALMYRDFDRESKEIELQKSLIELEQMQTDLAVSKAETEAQPSKAIRKLAIAGSKAKEKYQARISALAQKQMRQRKS
jgi:hypothetical protein